MEPAGTFYIPEIVGSGAALLDYDGDGDLDVYLVQGAMLEPGKSPSETWFPPGPGWRPGHRLYRNELIPGGSLKFREVTAEAGVELGELRDGGGGRRLRQRWRS